VKREVGGSEGGGSFKECAGTKENKVFLHVGEGSDWDSNPVNVRLQYIILMGKHGPLGEPRRLW
jgi:hypothetical protein